MTPEEKTSVILDALAEAICEKDRAIKELLAKVDDLAQQLAVTEQQLADTKRTLARYTTPKEGK